MTLLNLNDPPKSEWPLNLKDPPKSEWPHNLNDPLNLDTELQKILHCSQSTCFDHKQHKIAPASSRPLPIPIPLPKIKIILHTNVSFQFSSVVSWKPQLKRMGGLKKCNKEKRNSRRKRDTQKRRTACSYGKYALCFLLLMASRLKLYRQKQEQSFNITYSCNHNIKARS